jgi:hypothetical protein
MGVYIKSRFTYDPDALAFIQASSIPNTSQKLAINQLVLDLKAYGIWGKMRAIYPMIGGSAFYHKWNLKDPRDLDAAYRLNFVGGWTHSSTGAKPNGINGYADTFLVSDSLSLNSIHSSFYSRTNFTDNNYKINLGYLRTTPDSFSDIALDWNGVSVFRLNNGGVYTSVSSGGNNQGFYTVSRTASNVIRAFKNGSMILNATDASNITANNRSFYIGAGNNNGTAQYFTPNECAFASLGEGLTDTEAVNFRTAVQAFQTTLGRNIGTQTVSDADAQAFINAAVIQDQVQANAVNQLVIDMKAASIWTKMKAVYPFVGGTATTHKWNLKNPLDTNAAFRLTFTGGWTHSSTGALPNGTNGYSDTFLNANTVLQQFSHHHAFYHNTDNSGTGLRSMGGAQGATSETFRTTIESSGTVLTFRDLQLTNAESGLTAATLKGFRASSRTANNNMFIVKADGTSTTATTTTATAILPNLNCYLAAHASSSVPQNYSIMSLAFASIGDGLTTTDGLNLRNIVQTFQTTLGRNV